MPRKPSPIAERFWPKVDRSHGPNACWPWLGYIDRDGYGKFNLSHRVCVTASRLAYELTFGPIPAGKLVCHRCDNPGCCNPAHLYAGNHSQNNRDAFQRGRRSCRGESGPSAKLTTRQVQAIRRRYARGDCTQQELARLYQVDHTTISAIIRRVSWSHI